MSDLVERLLAAIEETERTARAAAEVPRGARQGNYRQARGLTVTLPARAWTDYVATLDPAHVLRLCQAHREIIEHWQSTKDATDPARSASFLAEIAEVRLGVYDDVIKSLAGGYGIQKENSDG